jgi:hypothetical protein
MSGSLGSSNISLSAAEVLYGNGPTQLVTANDTNLRYLAGIPQSGSSSAISFSQLVNSAFVVTSSAGASVNVYTTATAAGWNGNGPLWFQIIGNTYSSSTGTASIQVGGNFPKGLILQVNPGVYVIGRGGSGSGSSTAGGAGGVAIAVSGYTGGTLYLNNLGTIAGGGGGGGGGGQGQYSYSTLYGNYTTYYNGGTGGGGAAFGTGANAGTLTTGGGAGGGAGGFYYAAGSGGTGGSPGNSGSAGNSGSLANGGGPNSGAAGPGAGGAAGAATTGTVSVSAVWINTGTRLGTVG